MATTVQPTTRERTSVAATGTPWYRDRNRQLAAIAGAVVLAALIAWFTVTSGRRKQEFAARSLNQARAAAEAGNLPLASSELQKLIQTYKGTDAAHPNCSSRGNDTLVPATSAASARRPGHPCRAGARRLVRDRKREAEGGIRRPQPQSGQSGRGGWESAFGV